MTLATQVQPAEDQKAAPFQLRGGSFTLIVLRLTDPKDPTFYPALMDKIGQAPGFFRHAPVVLDLQDLANAPPFNMAEIGRRLRQHRLIPIGVQNGTEEQNRAALNAGMSILPEGRQAPLRTSTTTDSTPAEPHIGRVEADPVAGTSAKLITQPVRSGQQIYAHRGDLVVLASISPGAELLADGHIHVYGALRGRAMAGISGDTNARIFCQTLEAELVSLAGYWRVRDDIPERLIGKPVQIFLEAERMTIEPLP